MFKIGEKCIYADWENRITYAQIEMLCLTFVRHSTMSRPTRD